MLLPKVSHRPARILGGRPVGGRAQHSHSAKGEARGSSENTAFQKPTAKRVDARTAQVFLFFSASLVCWRAFTITHARSDHGGKFFLWPGLPATASCVSLISAQLTFAQQTSLPAPEKIPTRPLPGSCISNTGESRPRAPTSC